MTTGEPDPDIGTLNEKIKTLRLELQLLEDWHHAGPEYDARDRALRSAIHDLELERDLLL